MIYRSEKDDTPCMYLDNRGIKDDNRCMNEDNRCRNHDNRCINEDNQHMYDWTTVYKRW